MNQRAWLGMTLGAGGGLACVAILAAHQVQPFYGWLYPWAWFPTLLALDAGLAVREGRAPLLGRPRFALSLALWSVPVWLLFEFANLRLANWYYVSVPASRTLRWSGEALAFATVLPAIYLASRWLESLGVARDWRRPCFQVRPVHRAISRALGAGFLGLAAWRPDAFFPLLWGAVTLLLEPWNYNRDPRASLLGDLAAGRYARIVRLFGAGLAIGLLWEGFNYLAEARWIYTVPGLEGGKLFEMPVPGFLGFPVFALDCFVLYQTLTLLGVAVPGWGEARAGERWVRAGRLRRGVASTAAAGFTLLVLAGIDRWTVDSVQAGLAKLPGASPVVAAALLRAGVGSVPALARADAAALAGRAGLDAETAHALVAAARLANLQGLGATNAAALWAEGVRSPCALAGADPARVARAIRAERRGPNAARPARLRVWLRAARRVCRPG